MRKTQVILSDDVYDLLVDESIRRKKQKYDHWSMGNIISELIIKEFGNK